MGRLTLNFVPRSSPLASNSLPPLFLLPSFVGIPCQCFSTSPRISAPKRYREKNKQRGVSAIRRTGPRIPLSISKYELPRPVVNPPARKEFKTNPEHGLWGFFNKEKTPMSGPEDEIAYGVLGSGAHRRLLIRRYKLLTMEYANDRQSMDVRRTEHQKFR